jgi:predicted porin
MEFEPGEGTTVGVYAGFEPSIKSVTNGNGDSETEYTDEGSIIGLSGEHRINDSITVFAFGEFEFLSDDTDPSFTFDEGAFGFKGDWGKIQGGGFDSVYEDLIVDATEIAEIAEISDETLAEEDNLIAYYSPSFNGFSFRTQIRFAGDGDAIAESGQDSTELGFAIAGGYTADNWGVYAGYDDLNTNLATAQDAQFSTLTGTGGETIEVKTSDAVAKFVNGETYGLAGTFAIGPAEFAAKYAETSFDNADEFDAALEDTTRAAIRGMFDYGSGKLYAAAQEVDPDNSEDRTEFTVGADYKPISNLKLYSEAGWFDRNNDAGDLVGVGAIYEF